MAISSTGRTIMTQLRRFTVSLCVAAFLFVTFGHFVQHHVDIANSTATVVMTMASADLASDDGDIGKIGHAAHCHTCSTNAIDVSYDFAFAQMPSDILYQSALPLTAVFKASDSPPTRA